MAKKFVLPTPSGKLQGLSVRSCLGDDYYSFKGIPYAKPPVGILRFQDPQPVEPWTEVRDVTSHGPISAQYEDVTKRVTGAEDCLFANVYTRSVDANNRAPVMVWIHGGAFTAGSGNDEQFGPDFLLQEDVVLVTFNYRLGIFGFLNLDDEIAPGNQGLKDQVMLLQWVKTHILYFGGDPNNVTIFGCSAGSASVHYLNISPLAQGLFHKAICQSGTALCPWAFQSEPKKFLYEFLELLGFKERKPKLIIEFLRSIDSIKLIETQTKMVTAEALVQVIRPFIPSLDDKSSNPFMPMNISEAIQKGVQVPLIIGYNSLEGLLFYQYLKDTTMEKLNYNLEKYIHPSSFDMLKNFSSTFEDLKKLYLKKEKISDFNIRKFYELIGDLSFVYGTHSLAKIQVDKSAAATYFYKLSFDENVTLFKRTLNAPVEGVSHTDELNYLFKANRSDLSDFQQLQEGTGGDKVMQQMIELWVNFAKTGRPTPTTTDLVPLYWLPLVNDEVIRYLNIDEELRMEKMLSVNQRHSFRSNLNK